MILITGAAGKTGRAIISALARKKEPVRALVHRPDQSRLVESLGAQEAVVGDMRDEDTLKRVTRDVRAVYHICPNVSPDELLMGRTAISAARAAGVEQFAFHSLFHPGIQAMTHHWNKLLVEEALLESGLPFTILQPMAYMQNVLGAWKAITERGVYQVPYSVESRQSIVDLEDVAQAAAVVLTEPGHLGATYELAGPEALTQSQLADIIGKQLGRRVNAEQVTIEAWRSQAQASGMGAYQIETLVKMFQFMGRYGICGNSRVLSYLIQRPPTTFREFVERTIRQRKAP